MKNTDCKKYQGKMLIVKMLKEIQTVKFTMYIYEFDFNGYNTLKMTIFYDFIQLMHTNILRFLQFLPSISQIRSILGEY